MDIVEYKRFLWHTKWDVTEDRCTIDCAKGLWGVSAPTVLQAEQEALHYYRQYYSDGEYNRSEFG